MYIGLSRFYIPHRREYQETDDLRIMVHAAEKIDFMVSFSTKKRNPVDPWFVYGRNSAFLRRPIRVIFLSTHRRTYPQLNSQNNETEPSVRRPLATDDWLLSSYALRMRPRHPVYSAVSLHSTICFVCSVFRFGIVSYPFPVDRISVN